MDQDNQFQNDEPEMTDTSVQLAKEPVSEVQPPVVEVTKRDNSAMETASLVLGILSLIGACCCGLGIILGGLAILFGCLSRKGQKMSGMALAGVITGAIGLALGIPGIIITIVYWGVWMEEALSYSQVFDTVYQISIVAKAVFV